MAGLRTQLQQKQRSCSNDAANVFILQTQLHSRLFPPGRCHNPCAFQIELKHPIIFLSCNMVMHAHIIIAFFPDTARKCTLDASMRPGKYGMHTKIITALFTHTAEHAAPGLGLGPGLAC